MKCPICKKTAMQGYLPFCSKKCADIDLNRWLTGDYFISSTVTKEEKPFANGKVPDSKNPP